MADIPIILSGQQLRTLARLVYLEEEQAIASVQFQSEPAAVKYLRDCRACYDSVVSLLNEASELGQQYANSSTKATIASDIFGYITNSVNLAVQLVRNYSLRMDYMKNIREFSKEIWDQLAEVEGNDMVEIEKLAKQAYDFRNAKLEAIRQHQTPASRQFSIALKESGLQFEDLIRTYQNRRGFTGPFKDLEDVQKIQVYEDIVAASGRSRFLVNALSKAVGAAGIAVIMFTAGILVWDLFTNHDIFQATTRDAVETIAGFGGAVVGEIVGVTLAIAVGASAGFALMAGIISGFVGAYLIGEFAGWFINSIFAGTYDTISTEGYRCYVAELPDGEALARELVRQTNLNDRQI